MIITTKVVVSFLIPEELGELKQFESNNDLTEWRFECLTNMITYTKIKAIKVGLKEQTANDNS